MKLKIQLGKYLLNIGPDIIGCHRHGNGAWCLFFGIGSLGRWPWMRGFSWGRVR